MPIATSKQPLLSQFLRREANIGFAEVTGEKENRGTGYGLEIPFNSAMWVSEPDVEVQVQMGQSGRAAHPPTTISKLFKETCNKFASQNALNVKRGGRWHSYSYAQFYEHTMSVSKSLLAAGLKRFESVSIMASNSPEWMMADIGAIQAGGLSNGIYTTNSLDITRYILKHSNTRVAFGDTNAILEKLLEAGSDISDLIFVQSVPGSVDPALKAKGVLEWSEFIELGKNIQTAEVEAIMDSQRPGHCSTLLYTSGTTGQPKGVMASHDNLVWNSLTLYQDYKITQEYTMVSYLPFSHIAAQIVDMMIPLHSGCKVFFALPDAMKGSLIETLREIEPNIFFGVPRVWEKLKENIEPAVISGEVPLESVKKMLGLINGKVCFTAASPISLNVLEFFDKAGVTIFSIYGASENMGPGTVSLPGANLLGSVGRSIEGSETKIHEPNSDGDGEICFKGRYNFMGYLHDAEKTAKVTDKNGWYYTGDIGHVDDNGFYFITGRIKEILITSGGENVAPVPIEQEMKKQLRMCSSCVVVGDGKKFLSMLVTLKCRLAPDGLPSDELDEEAIDICKSLGVEATTVSEAVKSSVVHQYIEDGMHKANEKAVSNVAKIKKFAFLPRDFSIYSGELTPTAKLKRTFVAEIYAKIIDQFYL
ncbi:Long-chain-fatty-acid--CoA ligase ACSBG2 [Oopsacas minuta]|uniref:long-chain-fatty-acid--CoA ligase n=1 Tax=Oopsacas minuta TaxID=111878 RepID=A0AAV7JNX5_9METZ|nr:Long-chain-fatty-acid--CoA ligase ACSBG2 [Oopsacas minuta]